MAISGVTLRGEIGGRGGLTLAVSPTVAIAVGKIAFAACVADNSGTTDGATTFHTLTDTDGHTWTRLWEETETDGAASDGVSQSLWATVVTSEIGTGDSVTFGSPDAGAANARVLALFEATFSGGAGFALENKALARGTEEVTLGSLPSREYLFIHFSGAEGEDNAATADADYTALTTLRSGTTGASDTNVCMHLAVRVATLTTDTATSTLFTSVTNLLTSLSAVYEPVSGAQGLTGTLFTKAPTFSTGTITPGAVGLTGTLFTKAPTFFTGTVLASQALAGTLFTKAATFLQGALTVGAANLSGVLFQKAPTFFQGTVTTGAVDLAGTLFQNSPAFFAGTLTAGAVDLAGVLYQNTPVFNAGTMTQEGGPQVLGGDLFQKAPTFPQGSVTTGAVGITGVLFQSTPSFNVGAVASTYDLAGVLYQNSPTFSQGEVVGAQLLDGVLFQSTPVFPAGSIGVAGAIDGVLYQNAPVFFTGSMGQLGGSFWRPNPVAFTLNPAAFDPVLRDEVPPWAIEVDGEEFELAPSFFAGALS